MKFEQIEKRTLAASLVLSFSLTAGDTHLIKCWDPESVYFLSDSQGKCIRNLPYAICLAPVPYESAESRYCEARFALLARLLMEIECGVSLEHMQMNNTRHLQSSGDTFEDFIDDQVSLDLSDSRRSYLRAVQMCFRFQHDCRREGKRLSARGHPDGQGAATRNLIHSIVQKIQKAVDRQLHPEVIFYPDHHRPAADHSFWPSVSPQSQQLGMSNGSLALSQTTVVPNSPDEVIVQKRLQVGTRKQVRFEIESEEEKEENTSSGVLGESPVVETDDCELFGDMNTQEYPEDLCKSARKWITAFKISRREKTSVHSEQRIKVAVLDTGVDIIHPDIRGNVCSHRSFIDGNATSDHSGHGTHIAGVLLSLTTNIELYVGQVIGPRKSDNRRPIIEALIHAREIWKVNMISLSFGFHISSGPDLVQKEIQKCLAAGITVFASASNDAGNKPRTYPGNYDDVLCIHSATGAGNASSFNPSPISGVKNFSFVGDCVKSCWPMDRLDYDNEKGQKYLSGTSIATPVAIAVALFMINYIRTKFPDNDWNIDPLSPNGIRKIFTLMAHQRGGYDWVSPEWFFTGDENRMNLRKAELKVELGAYESKSSEYNRLKPNS
jgi:hypothetical protein